MSLRKEHKNVERKPTRTRDERKPSSVLLNRPRLQLSARYHIVYCLRCLNIDVVVWTSFAFHVM
ncbi:hypothetical protein BC827DRAFT_1168612 [Russula dissimulans]|nr:hypothetical protein BC827DRAFT_1168612 [Russula dissimulans]